MPQKLIVLFFYIFGLCLTGFAQGDLLITPKRVVFEGNMQKEELNLIKIGTDTAVHSISFLQYNKKEDGSFVRIEKPDSGQMFADPYLRVFPRRVTLAPREPQVIALQYRRQPNMAEGEYRSHLYFRSEKENQPLGMDNQTSDTAQLKIELIPIFGLSIPVIIRTGITNAKSTLSDLKIEVKEDTTQYLKLTINRTGNASVYGDLNVIYVPVEGKPYEIGVANGVGVYTNLSKRSIAVKLKTTPGMNLKNGKLKVEYVSSIITKPEIFSQAELQLK